MPAPDIIKSSGRPAVAYLRVSTSQQAAEGISLEAQEAALRRHCEARGLSLIALHTDAGISGRSMRRRPALRDALTAVCAAKGTLVVYSLSRLARSTKDALEISARLEKAGASLVSLTEAIDTTTPAGSLFFTVLAAVAQFESDVTGERVRGVKAHQRARGRFLGGPPPLGYSIGPDGQLVPDEGEQRAVERVRALHSEGKTLRQIQALLSSEGWPTRTGKPWSLGSVAAVVRSTSRAEEAA